MIRIPEKATSLISIIIFLILICLQKLESYSEEGFSFNGVLESNGGASVEANNPITFTLINGEEKVFYRYPLVFKNSTNASVNSFSSTFIFKIIPEYPDLGAHGLAFFISPSKDFSGALPGPFLGLFNKSSVGSSTNHIVAIEFDVIQNTQFEDINDNHVGIDINSLISNKSISAGYYADDDGKFRDVRLIRGDPIQVWIEYDGVEKQLNVTLSPIDVPKPMRSLLSSKLDLSPFILDTSYVGFSASTGVVESSVNILGWNFKMNGRAPPLPLPPSFYRKKKKINLLAATASPIGAALFLAGMIVLIILVRRRWRFAEVVEDWEKQYGPQRFTYKDLYDATKTFTDKELLGRGGFGRVYGGILPKSKIQVAVKRVTHDSRQGMREFVAEIATIGRLQHSNLVRLLGYCRRKGELLLVYEFMSNGSLDKFLLDHSKPALDWTQRYKIIKDISVALLYLHQQWVQVVIHRDVKASNVLLDDGMNAKLGDFGLAKLCDHGTDPQTSRPAGTLGFIAPELARTGKASTRTDVFAFGAFLLEVACGRRPVEPRALPTEILLVDWVTKCWRGGTILQTVDPRLGNVYVVEEMELVLKLGLICSHPVASARPTMSSVVHYLGGSPLPQADFLAYEYNQAYDDSVPSHHTTPPVTFTESFRSFGR